MKSQFIINTESERKIYINKVEGHQDLYCIEITEIDGSHVAGLFLTLREINLLLNSTMTLE